MAKREINGISAEYVERGDGATVLFVHGSVSDYRTWQAQQNEFAIHFHAVSYSRRYHWPNAKIAEDADYSMAQHVDDLQALIQSFDTTPVHLVGHSYGAFLCLLLAIRAPQLVHSLVLAEPPVITLFISVPPKPQQILKLLLTRPRTAITLIKFAATGLNPATKAIEKDNIEEAIRLFGTAVLGPDTFKQLSTEQKEQVRANLIKSEFLGSGFMPLSPTDVRRVQIPTLLINGQDSPPLFHRLIDRLHELMPHSERIEIPSASHIMHEQNASAYNTAVLAFLESYK